VYAGDVSCAHLAANRPKMYEQLARALSDFYETAKGRFALSDIKETDLLSSWLLALFHACIG